MDTNVRLDKFLWAIRIFKTRTQAAEAIDAGKVMLRDAVNEKERLHVKASRIIKIGDRYTIREGAIVKDIEVLQPLSQRMKAGLVAPYFKDHTPPTEYEKLRLVQQASFIYHTGGKRFNKSQRPTKKDRRDMDDWQAII